MMNKAEITKSHSPDAEKMRSRIIETTAGEMLRAGYQAASVGKIIQILGISKGGFYHHFPSKKDLGYAVLDEVYAEQYMTAWQFLHGVDQPFHVFVQAMKDPRKMLSEEVLLSGDPLDSLGQEMSKLDDGFRQRVDAVYQKRSLEFITLCKKSIASGELPASMDAEEFVPFLLASFMGAKSIAKNAQNYDAFIQCIGGLISYIESLFAIAETEKQTSQKLNNETERI